MDILIATVNLEAYEDGSSLQYQKVPSGFFYTVISLKDSQQHPFHGHLHIPAVPIAKKNPKGLSQ